MSFQTLGFPLGTGIDQIVVCEPAQSLVAQFFFARQQVRMRRLFVRRFDERKYHELVADGDGYDIWDPTPSPTTPHLYFHRLVWRDWNREPGADWDGLYRVHCETGALTCLVSPNMAPSDTRISRILGISGDGNRLHVVASSTQPGPNGDTSHYGVAALDLATLTMRPLTPLRAMFV